MRCPSCRRPIPKTVNIRSRPSATFLSPRPAPQLSSTHDGATDGARICHDWHQEIGIKVNIMPTLIRRSYNCPDDSSNKLGGASFLMSDSSA